jgi:hypothetical protein
MIIIGLVISNNVVGLFSQQEDKEYDEFVKKIEDSACMYVETVWDSTTRSNCKASNKCTVTIDELITKGYIDDNLKDPSTAEYVTDNKDAYKVNVTWDKNNIKECKINS